MTTVPRILMVVTSHDRLRNTGEKTGLWLEELAAPYLAFTKAGVQVDIASPKGGPAPADPKRQGRTCGRGWTTLRQATSLPTR